MPSAQYKHIFLPSSSYTTRGYTKPPRKIDNTDRIPNRDRGAHSNHLQLQLERAWADAELDQRKVGTHYERNGTYLVFSGEPGFELAYQSLESLTSGIRLLNVHEAVIGEARKKLATLYVPFTKRHLFLNKLKKYETEDTKAGKPKNAALINSVSDICYAVLESFWREEERPLIPQGTQSWIEVWISSDQLETREQFEVLLTSLEIEYARGWLEFPERSITLIYVNRTQLQQLIGCTDFIAEFRIAKEVASYFLDLENQDQVLYVQALLNRVAFDDPNQVSVCILDGGVNNGHLLLKPVLKTRDLHTVDQSWGTHDHDRGGHGTGMAGIAVYGDLIDLLNGKNQISVNHRLESAKILPPHGQNPIELWGYMTAEGISLAEIQAPDRKRIICMAVTATDTLDRGRPSSWSAEIDSISSGAIDNKQRLIVVSAGNVASKDWINYHSSNLVSDVQDPGQSWNALTVGAFTEKVQIPANDPTMRGYHPAASYGGLSPFSATSVTWENKWPIKPEVVLEGGNVAFGPNNSVFDHDSLQLLSTCKDPQVEQFVPFGQTSASCALASRIAAQIQVEYPDKWPETIRGLIVHTAEWTDEMRRRFLPVNNPMKKDYSRLLRICGYGVPNLERALYCASNVLTLISEAEIQPFDERGGRYVTRDMHLYSLPWPINILRDLGETRVSMRITLSYFVEPSPGEIGWKDRYRYASHALRFEVNGPEESETDFVRRVNKQARDEEDDEYTKTKGPTDKWLMGDSRNVGSIHSDIWEGQAVQLAESNKIAVYPIVGWWRERHHLQKWNKSCRYSLIVSIHTPEIAENIYIPVAQQIGVPIEIRID